MDDHHQFPTGSHPGSVLYESAFPNPAYSLPPLQTSQHSAQLYYPPNPSALPPPSPTTNHQQQLNHESLSDSSPYHPHDPHQFYQNNSYSSALTHSDAHSSSFESHGSSHSHGGVPPYVQVGFTQHPNDSHHHGHSASSAYHNHPMMAPPPPEYRNCYPAWLPTPPLGPLITNIKPTDVLSGRGGATNSHSGNRAFRAMVKQYQGRYLKAKKKDKPGVAAMVVQLIRQKGGRFLRRCDFPTDQGVAQYYDIGDRRATEKACQALREGAPGIRAKRRGKDATSSSESSHTCDQNEGQAGCEKENETPPAQRDDNPGCEYSDAQREPVTVIRPSARLLRRAKVDPIALDELTEDERSIYIADFYPPKETFQKSEGKPSATLEPHDYNTNTEEAHPVVSV